MNIQRFQCPGRAHNAAANLGLVWLLATALLFGGCNRQVPATGGDPVTKTEAKQENAQQEYKLNADTIARYGIKVESVQVRRLESTFTAPGRVAWNAETIAHVGSPLRGRVVGLSVKLGSEVKAGDPLFVVESPEFGEAQGDLLVKRSAVLTAGPTADLARTIWERAKGLFESSQGISLTDVQRREAEYKVAAAALKAAEANAIAAETRLQMLGMPRDAVHAFTASGELDPRRTITAPITGQVVEREVTLGELVGPEQPSLLMLADRSTLWVLADVPEARLHEIALGAKAWVQAGPMNGRRHEGVVGFVSPMLDAATRTAKVRIEVRTTPSTEAPATALLPGMFAQVEMVTGHADNASTAGPVVPEIAVQTIGGASVVFVPVANEPDTFTQRQIVVGKSVGGLMPVLSGLQADDRVVTQGSFILKAHAVQSAAAKDE